MTPQEIQHFEELIVKAVQSGKQETSGLVDMIMHKLEKQLEPLIDKYVNGKINKLLEMTKLQNETLSNIQNEQARVKIQLANLDTGTAPIIKEYETDKTVKKFFSDNGVLAIKLASIIGAIITIYQFIKHISNIKL